MDALRNHHLFPKLIELAGSEQKAEKIIAAIPPAKLTIWGALRDACYWHIRGRLDFPHACEILEKLSRSKPDGVIADGYYARYSATLDQCWEGVVRDVANYGLRIWRDDDKIYLGYMHLPRIHVSTPDIYSGRPFSVHALQFDLTELQRRAISAYGTPYQEEVITLRLLAQLPQPIAEAIEDCIRGVMERRFIKYFNPGLCYQGDDSVESEIIYTAHPARVYPSNEVRRMKDRRAWEEVAARLIEEERETQIRAANTKYGRDDSSDEDFERPTIFGRDDGW